MLDASGLIPGLLAGDPVLLGATAAALVVVALMVAWSARLVRRAGFDLKLQIGTTAVQGGMAWAVITGTYQFCVGVLGLPAWEAMLFALFFEASTWVAIGRIIQHGKQTLPTGEKTTGMGSAGPWFWAFSILGGLLAVLAGHTAGEMLGRAIIVTIGTGLWFMTLQAHTRPASAPSQLRWHPRRLLVQWGVLEPADVDVVDEHEEWQIRRLARAMRLANGRGLARRIGQRALVARAEQTSTAIIDAARHRFAVAHLLTSTVHTDSEVMRGVLESVMDEVSPTRRAELEQMRTDIDRLHAELEHDRHEHRRDSERQMRELATAREEFAAERANAQAELDRERRALAAERMALAVSARNVPPTAATPAATGDDSQMVRKVAEFIAAERAAGQPCGQRPVANRFKVGRRRADELIKAAEQYLADQSAITPTSEPPHVNGARVPIPTHGATP